MDKFFVDYKISQLEFENSGLKRKIETLNKLIDELRKQIHILEEATDNFFYDGDLEAEHLFNMED